MSNGLTLLPTREIVLRRGPQTPLPLQEILPIAAYGGNLVLYNPSSGIVESAQQVRQIIGESAPQIIANQFALESFRKGIGDLYRDLDILSPSNLALLYLQTTGFNGNIFPLPESFQNFSSIMSGISNGHGHGHPLEGNFLASVEATLGEMPSGFAGEVFASAAACWALYMGARDVASEAIALSTQRMAAGLTPLLISGAILTEAAGLVGLSKQLGNPIITGLHAHEIIGIHSALHAMAAIENEGWTKTPPESKGRFPKWANHFASISYYILLKYSHQPSDVKGDVYKVYEAFWDWATSFFSERNFLSRYTDTVNFAHAVVVGFFNSSERDFRSYYQQVVDFCNAAAIIFSFFEYIEKGGSNMDIVRRYQSDVAKYVRETKACFDMFNYAAPPSRPIADFVRRARNERRFYSFISSLGCGRLVMEDLISSWTKC